MVPWVKTDDLEGGIYLPQDGLTDPTNTAMSLARGVKNRGIVQPPVGIPTGVNQFKLLLLFTMNHFYFVKIMKF